MTSTIPLSSLQRPPHGDPDDHVRIVAVSDTHNAHREVTVPPCDILIHAGDFTDIGTRHEITAFCEWLGEQTQAQHRVVIAGNHEISLDASTYRANGRRFGHRAPLEPTSVYESMLREHSVYLLDESVELCGLTIHGSPWQPAFYEWAFNLPRGDVIAAHWDKTLNRAADILVTHGPPMGHGDVSCRRHLGCADLLRWIEAPDAAAPPLHIFGHIHEGRGATANGRTVFVNAAHMCGDEDPSAAEPGAVSAERGAVIIDVPKDPSKRRAWAAAFGAPPTALPQA